jgi:hypothetical protein
MNHSESMRNVKPPLQRSTSIWSRIRAWPVNDAIWHPAYNSLVAAVLVVWITVLLIGIAAWAQFAFPAASQPVPQAEAHTPARVEAAAGATGDVR